MRETVLALALVAACSSPRREGDDAGTTSDVTAVAFTQALAGKMWANPIAYPTIPVHVAVTGHPTSVTVSIGDQSWDARADGDRFTADVSLATLGDGAYPIVATADHVSAMATLELGRAGIQFTDFASAQNAGTPRAHRAGDHVYLTWTDISSGTRVAWLVEIDGAGHRLGTPVALVGGPGKPDVLYARTAFGSASIGVLYQQNGGPYVNLFTVVGMDGTQLVAPMPLDPANRYGSFGGDIVFAAGGYDVVWRTNDGMGSSDVRWMHVDEKSGAVTGPVIVAQPGHDDPHGGFDPIYDVAVRRDGDASLVAFRRYEYNTALASEVMRCQIAAVASGAVANTDLAEVGSGLYWDDDCRVLADDTGGIAVWAAKDLNSSDDNPPDTLFATRFVDGHLAANRGDGAIVIAAPEARDEPALVVTSAGDVLAWADSRSYATSMQTGQIQLYAAPISGDLAAGAPVGFLHTHLIDTTSLVNGVGIDTNAILVWVDERHGGTILDPRPEVYLETVWQ
jgi:hypothetical protein